jgi:hypothetical protein
MLSGPIWATRTPEKELTGKRRARKRFEIINHETDRLRDHCETENTFPDMNHMEIRIMRTNARSKSRIYQNSIKTKLGMTKCHDKMKTIGSRGRVDRGGERRSNLG